MDQDKEISLVSNATCTWFPRRANEQEDEAECICQIGGDAVEEAHREQQAAILKRVWLGESRSSHGGTHATYKKLTSETEETKEQ